MVCTYGAARNSVVPITIGRRVTCCGGTVPEAMCWTMKQVRLNGHSVLSLSVIVAPIIGSAWLVALILAGWMLGKALDPWH